MLSSNGGNIFKSEKYYSNIFIKLMSFIEEDWFQFEEFGIKKKYDTNNRQFIGRVFFRNVSSDIL